MMRIKTKFSCFAMALCMSGGVSAATEYKIVTASEHGTYLQIGKDLAKHVAEPAGISLNVLPSKGSVENVKRLRDERGTKFALVQSDVYQAFLDQAATGNQEAERIVRPLRVIAPLYDEEIHLVVRADSPLNHIHEIQDKKINIGPLGSGTAMTATTLYRMMFGTQMATDKLHTLSNEEALLKLAKGKDIDVVVVVAGQPAAIFTGMEPGVEKHFKLLKFDRTAPAVQPLLDTYAPATVKASNYPHWLAEDLPSLSIKTYLVTYDYRLQDTRDTLTRFARSLCKNFSVLQKNGHPKWRQVSLQLPELSKGWSYYPPTEREIRSCKVAAEKRCALQEKVMGLCVDRHE